MKCTNVVFRYMQHATLDSDPKRRKTDELSPAAAVYFSIMALSPGCNPTGRAFTEEPEHSPWTEETKTGV